MKGSKVEHVHARISKVNRQYNIKNVVIHVGGNNIPMDNPENLNIKLVQLLNHTRRLMPHSKIYFSAIIPRLGNKYLPGINNINRNMRLFCAENGFQMIPHYQFYSDANNINFNLLNKDAIHPTKKGSSTIAKNIIAIYRNYKRYK